MDTQKTYDPDKFDRPSLTIDVLLFTITDGELKLLLLKRKEWPYQGEWALPGSFVKMDESLDNGAKRILKEKTGQQNIFLEQLYSFGQPKRDPRTRVITVAYYALAPDRAWNLEKNSQAGELAFVSCKKLPKLAFDHNAIVEDGLKRLRSKLGYSNIAFGLLPDEFTLSQLQKIYEIIGDKKLDKRNFRKKIISTGFLTATNKKTTTGAHRPALTYRFTTKEIVNLD